MFELTLSCGLTMEKQQQQMRSKMTVKFKGYEHLYQDGKLLEISEEEKDILFSKDTESIEDLETKLIVAVSYMEFETPSSRRVLTVDLEEVNNGIDLLITEYDNEDEKCFSGYDCVGDVLNLELRVGNERSFEDQMTFAINGSYYDENDNKIESLLPENNTAKITYDNEKDMESFLSIIKIALKKWWKIDSL